MAAGSIKIKDKRMSSEGFKDLATTPRVGITADHTAVTLELTSASVEAEFSREEVMTMLLAFPDYMPTLDAATRFVRSNPATAASILIEHWRTPGDNDRCSNGKLRDIWKAAGGMVDKTKPGRVWIEADLLPGLLRLLAEIPNP